MTVIIWKRWRRASTASLLLLASGSVEWRCSSPARLAPKHLVLVVFDTLRADRMSLFGYPKPTTPFLESLASEALVFENAKAPAPWTVPSHSSLLTGLQPAQHRAQWGRIFLDEKFTTLAETLRANDFCTTGFSANSLVSRRTGLAQGFDSFKNVGRKQASRKKRDRTASILEAIPKVLDSALERNCRLFLFVNFMDTHIPYNTSKYGRQFGVSHGGPVRNAAVKWKISAGLRPFSDRERRLHAAAYDAAVRSSDDAARQVVSLLRDRGMLESTVLAFTSDHGEGLGDHQELGHVLSVWEEQLAVPLVIRLPKGYRSPQRITATTSLTAFAPSVLDWLEVDRPDVLSDSPTLDTVSDQPVTADYRSYFSESARKTNLKMAGRHPALVERVAHRHVVYCDAFKLIVTARKEVSFFNLEDDPLEASDLADTTGDRSTRLQDCLETYRSLLDAGTFTRFDDAVTAREQTKSALAVDAKLLRSLGYVN